MLKQRLINIALRLKRASWRTWLVVAVLVLVIFVILRFVLGGFLRHLFSTPEQRTQAAALKAAGRLETSIAATRDRIRQASAEIEARAEELDEIKALPDKQARLARLAALSNRSARGR